jgi:hypothetical protein
MYIEENPDLYRMSEISSVSEYVTWLPPDLLPFI